MQPDDQNGDFKQPEQTPYYSAPAQPVEPAVEQPQAPQQVTSEPVEIASAEEAPKSEASVQLTDTTEPVHWQAAEYIHQEKNPLWFVIFSLVVLVLIAGAIFVQAWTFVALIPVMAVALFLYARRPPHEIDYVLSSKGLFINDVLHSFNEFKSFGVVRDADEYSIMLMPVRRFRPGLSVYFPENIGEAIVDLLGSRLPMQELHLDAFDRVVRALRI